MAYMTHNADLSRSESEADEQAVKSSHIDMARADRNARPRFVEGQIDEDLPTIDRLNRGVLAKDLEDAVRQAVIPRLYARQIPTGIDGSPVESPDAAKLKANCAHAIISNGAVDHLLRLVLAGRSDAQEQLLRELHGKSVPIRTLLEDVVVPVANEIGRAWVDDQMSFAEVTLTIGRMQTAVANFTASTLNLQERPEAPLVLLSPVPGEQHVFGAVVLGNLLNSEGYATDTMLDASAEDLCRQTSIHDYAAIGLSCNSDRTLCILPDLVKDLRSASRNRNLKVMLGGWALHEENESLHSIGADLIVTDRRSAIEDIVKLVGHGA